jgi:sulfur carrier protein
MAASNHVKVSLCKQRGVPRGGHVIGFLATHPRDNGRMATPVRIHFNGEPRDVAADTDLARLLELEGLAGRRVAVEINGEIIPRGLHARHVVRDGDRVEVVHALGGG